jgi:hypothetical protein
MLWLIVNNKKCEFTLKDQYIEFFRYWKLIVLSVNTLSTKLVLTVLKLENVGIALN